MLPSFSWDRFCRHRLELKHPFLTWHSLEVSKKAQLIISAQQKLAEFAQELNSAQKSFLRSSACLRNANWAAQLVLEKLSLSAAFKSYIWLEETGDKLKLFLSETRPLGGVESIGAPKNQLTPWVSTFSHLLLEIAFLVAVAIMAKQVEWI